MSSPNATERDGILNPRDFWDEMAEYYDEYVTSTRYKRFPPEVEASFFRRLLKRRRTILDLGCGTGRTIRLLTEHNYDFVGIDMSRRMLRAAERREAGDYVLSVIQSLPFRDSTFDAAFSLHGGFSHFKILEERLDACKEVSRVTRTDGLVLVDVPNPYRRDKGETYTVKWPAGNKEITTVGYAFWPKDLLNILEKSGFELKHLLGYYDLDDEYTKESRRLIAIALKK